ncbi:formate/nitrite transporter family protein [Corynebacterium sp. 12B]|uniref:formate/nitrite transporter family protein n=1 Tax=Corynebacterium sp. 12B TaxID=2080509 RepID=UPI00124ECDD0|nr:formate/nitrite transporter family protein [Corynebacterium sp. 12B]
MAEKENSELKKRQLKEHNQAEHARGGESLEEEIIDAYVDAAATGAERLQRSWRVMTATGLLGGVEITFGVLAYLLTLHETGSHLLAALAFSIGFVALLLAHADLFTEGFYYPVVAVAAGKGSWWEVLRMWSITLVTNFLGGAFSIWLVQLALPELHGTIADSAHSFLETGLSVQGVALAFLAGGAITLMTRMQVGSQDGATTIAAAVAGAFLLAGPPLFHSVLDSIIIFGAIFSGAPEVSFLAWIGWVWWVIPLNVLGGLMLTTLPRVLRGWCAGAADQF